MKFEHGSYIKGYGYITGLYHTKKETVYICHEVGQGYKYYKRPL